MPSTSATNIPAFAFETSNPLVSKLAIASRKLGLETPKRSANSRSAGSRSPGLRIPLNISFSIWRVTEEDSFSVIIFWKASIVQ